MVFHFSGFFEAPWPASPMRLSNPCRQGGSPLRHRCGSSRSARVQECKSERNYAQSVSAAVAQSLCLVRCVYSFARPALPIGEYVQQRRHGRRNNQNTSLFFLQRVIYHRLRTAPNTGKASLHIMDRACSRWVSSFPSSHWPDLRTLSRIQRRGTLRPMRHTPRVNGGIAASSAAVCMNGAEAH